MPYDFEKKLHSVVPQILDNIFPKGPCEPILDNIFPVGPSEKVLKKEAKKAHEYSVVEELVKEKEWRQAMDKTVGFYSKYIRTGRGSVDYSILLTKALSQMDIEDEFKVAEAFRLARIVAPMKERTCFAKQPQTGAKAGATGDVLPREMYRLLRSRAEYLVEKNSKYHTTTSIIERAISEIIMRMREFLDICVACDNSGITGEKYMRRCTVCIPRLVKKLEKLTYCLHNKRKAPSDITDDDEVVVVTESGDAICKYTGEEMPPTLLRMAWEVGNR